MRSVSRCRVCRGFVQQEDRYCWACGSDLRDGSAPAEARQVPGVREADPEAELTMRRAYLAKQRGQLEEAEQLLHGLLELNPRNVSALSLLSEVLRARGDLVKAVATAQQAVEAAAQGEAGAGELAPARRTRAEIEEGVVREVSGPSMPELGTPSGTLAGSWLGWQPLRASYLALATVGVAALFLALVLTFRGGVVGYVWFGVSFAAAGWCYYDAETRKLSGLLWGPVALCLGPFGLAMYLLSRH